MLNGKRISCLSRIIALQRILWVFLVQHWMRSKSESWWRGAAAQINFKSSRNENGMKNTWNNFFISFNFLLKWKRKKSAERRKKSSCDFLCSLLTVHVTVKCWKAFYLRFHNLLSHSSSKTSEIRSIVLFKSSVSSILVLVRTQHINEHT